MGRVSGAERCARCIGGKTPATKTERLTVFGETYELDLCDAHSAAFDRDLGAWLRVAREVEPARIGGLLSITREREQQSERRVVSAFAPKELKPGVVYVQKLPPGYDEWTLTKHALRRCEERDISQRDALIAACDPALSYPTEQEPGEWFHRRESITCVVNPKTREIITVMHTAEMGSEAI